ncbi:hypothetical protein AB6A40_004794 [Gnathostoma spinigerum]|uniref:Mediator of RNA polymerase II transcription subunit 4 n=1 Tax=Gnathostoma spinigerum TaxID=75299 RepID=A0ABD6EEQ7_9BILA
MKKKIVHVLKLMVEIGLDSDGRSLRDCLLEAVDDLDCIVKQMVSFILEKDRSCESLTSLTEAFHNKQEEIKNLLAKVPVHRQREELIRSLEKAVEERNRVIEDVEAKLQTAESALTGAVYQAGIKIKSIRQAEARKVNSEQVIRFANQISRSYSVAAPLYWQIGDASRPFPTEVELRVSSLAAPRVSAPTTTPALSLLRQPTSSTTGMLRGVGRGASPMSSVYSAASVQQQRSWSPRGGYGQQSSSPRNRGGSRSSSLVSPRLANSTVGLLQRHQSNSSPRMLNPSSFATAGKNIPPPVKNVEPMSSDSSSSSSSDEGSPS